MTGLYVLSIIIGLFLAYIFKGTLFKGEAVPFVMELPNYRMPGAKNVIRLLWEKAKDFIQKAFSIILIATIIVWFLQSFDLHFNLAADPSDSILAAVSGLLAPLFAPVGLGDWRIVSSLISGFVAKESVVSTMQVLFTEGVSTVLTGQSAAAMLVFSLLYTTCAAAIASIKRELGTVWAVSIALWQCVVAWAAAFATYMIAANVANAIVVIVLMLLVLMAVSRVVRVRKSGGCGCGCDGCSGSAGEQCKGCSGCDKPGNTD